MIEALIYSIVIATLLQPNAGRMLAAAVFAVVTLSHEVVLFDLDGLAYYASAALFDLGIIVALGAMTNISKLALRLQRVCAASILVNAVGWALWVTYYPPALYNHSFVVIYGWALYTLLTGSTRDDVGGVAMDGGYPRFCFDHSPRAFGYYNHGS